MRLVVGLFLVALGLALMVYAWTGFHPCSTPAFITGIFAAVIGIVIADEHSRT